MKNRAKSLKLKITVSAKGFLAVMIKPQYLAGFIVFSFISINLVIWSLNIELAQYIITEPSLSLADKLQFFSTSVRDVFITYTSAQALGMTIFSLLFGVNTAMLIYVLRNIGVKKMAKQSGASGVGLVVAVVAGGCVACGTSLLAPIVITLGVSSGAFLRDLSIWLNLFSSLLILFSIYRLGLLVATIKAQLKSV